MSKWLPGLVAAAGLTTAGSLAHGVTFTSGLSVDYLRGNFNNGALVRPSAGTMGIQQGVDLGQTNGKPPWFDNSTFVYTGQVFDADGIFAFAEQIDDNVIVKVDGVEVIRNQQWNVATTSSSATNNTAAGAGTTNFGMGPNGDGWHDLEIRLSHGGGGAGASGQGTNWSNTFGIGFANNPVVGSVNGNDYFKPIDPGDGSLFRTQISGFAGPAQPGLVEAILPGNGPNTSGNPNFGPNIVLDHVKLSPELGNTNAKPPWMDQTTVVYSGYIHDHDGIFSIAENIDDKVRVFINGKLAIQNDQWNVATTTGSTANNSAPFAGTLNWGPGQNGWHLLEIYMSNGGGGAGAEFVGNGWNNSFGLGYNPNGSASTNGAHYLQLVDPGDGSLLRTSLVPEPSTMLLLGLGGMASTMVRRRRKA